MLSVGKYMYMWLMCHSLFKIIILVYISILSLRPWTAVWETVVQETIITHTAYTYDTENTPYMTLQTNKTH
jgi:hypothetical protein